MKHNKTIIIIGSGWYGLYSSLLLKNKFNIIILEKNADIFNNSSYYNQNRLHLGYHYPRNNATRQICLNGYDKFINKFPEIVDDINKNYYIISKESVIDYESYLTIFNSNKKYEHEIINNHIFLNIDGNIIQNKEKIINSDKAYKYFKNKIDNNLIKFNYTVKTIKHIDNKIIINDELYTDYLLDCTYNQLNLDNSQKYSYELTLSLVYKKYTESDDFDALTCMDGDFFSIFPKDIKNKIYTLTHVKYTPLIKSNNIEDIINYKLTNEILNEKIKNMELSVQKYYKYFLDNFKYDSYFTSYKCKKISFSDDRDINIYNNNNIISVNCGKITGIFILEKYLNDFFEL